VSKKKKQQQAAQRAQQRVQTVGTSLAVRVDSKGRARSSANQYGNMPASAWVKRDSRLALDNAQAKKVNKKVEKYGGSLVGGKGMAVAGYVTVKGPSRMRQPKQGGGKIGGGKHQLAIYAPSAPAVKKPAPAAKKPAPAAKKPAPPAKSSAPISVGGATGNYATVEKLEQKAPKAPNFYDTANSFPQNPNFSPTGAPGVGGGNGSSPIYWDRTAENLFSYSDRLKDHNRQTGQWLSNIAAQDRKESESYLQNFARALPPAPSADQANDSVLSFLEQANKRLGFGSTMGGVTV
jgi:hypothetical protein